MRNTMKVLTAVVSLGLTAACGNFDRLLTVQTPSRLAEEAFLAPANAALMSASAVADYECALGGYVVASGLAAGELVDATQTAARWNYDRRNVEAVDALYSTSGCEGIGVYTPSIRRATPTIRRCSGSPNGPTRRSPIGSVSSP